MRHPVLVLAAASVLLLLPTLVLGTLISHSSPQNLTWASQFAEQVRAGILYPRWMPQSFDGLGSPAFYFYPPLPFWIDALVSIVTANALSVSYRLAVTTTAILFLSGLAMHAWLLKTSGKRAAALVGAIAYMAAPYHLFDIYTRGAFAETTAYAVLPVVMLALRLTIERARWGLPLLALAYAALLLSHLPTALLCSITVIPAYVLFTTRVARGAAALRRRRCAGYRPRGDLPVAGDRATTLDLGPRALDLVLPRQQLVRDGARALGRSRHHARDRLDRAGGRAAGGGPVLCPAAAP